MGIESEGFEEISPFDAEALKELEGLKRSSTPTEEKEEKTKEQIWEEAIKPPDLNSEDLISKIGEPKPLIDVETDFSDALELHTPEEITTAFQNNDNDPAIKIALHIDDNTITDRPKVIQDLFSEVKRRFFTYKGVNRDSKLGKDFDVILNETFSDIKKHLALNEKLDKIYIKITKAQDEFVITIINPAKPNADITALKDDHENNTDYKWHGRLLIDGVEKELQNEGYQVKDTTHLIQDEEGKTVAFEREIEAIPKLT